MPVTPKHPLRASIDGDEDKIDALKTLIASYGEVDPNLKSFIAARLDNLASNAAEVHLKDVDRPDGGFDLHITIKPKQHGKVKMVQGVATAG